MLVVPDERGMVGATFEVLLRFERSAPVTRTVTVVDLFDLFESVPGTDPRAADGPDGAGTDTSRY
jgi:hypothetical protein